MIIQIVCFRKTLGDASIYLYQYFLPNLGYAKEYRGIPLAPPMHIWRQKEISYEDVHGQFSIQPSMLVVPISSVYVHRNSYMVLQIQIYWFLIYGAPTGYHCGNCLNLRSVMQFARFNHHIAESYYRFDLASSLQISSRSHFNQIYSFIVHLIFQFSIGLITHKQLVDLFAALILDTHVVCGSSGCETKFF